jgi:hypothetical protein
MVSGFPRCHLFEEPLQLKHTYIRTGRYSNHKVLPLLFESVDLVSECIKPLRRSLSAVREFITANWRVGAGLI